MTAPFGGLIFHPELGQRSVLDRLRPPAGTDPNAGFLPWYQEWARVAGLDPNPDSPLQRYDYRAAYRAGASPRIDASDGKYHWPSEFKAYDHPNRFVNGIDTITGLPARPQQERADNTRAPLVGVPKPSAPFAPHVKIGGLTDRLRHGPLAMDEGAAEMLKLLVTLHPFGAAAWVGELGARELSDWMHGAGVSKLNKGTLLAAGLSLLPGGGKAVKFAETSAEKYLAAMQRFAKMKPDEAGFLTWRTAEEMRKEGMKMYLSPGASVGYAVHPATGDIRNVFNADGPHGAGAQAVAEAVGKRGGKVLDAFDTRLTNIYKDLGFKETWRNRWDEAYRPNGWNESKYGTPDVIGMEFAGDASRGEKGIFQDYLENRNRRYVPEDRRNAASIFPTLNERGALGRQKVPPAVPGISVLGKEASALARYLTPEEEILLGGRTGMQKFEEASKHLLPAEVGAEGARAGSAGHFWYPDAHDAIHAARPANPVLLAQTLAAYSPQVPVARSVKFTEETLGKWDNLLASGKKITTADMEKLLEGAEGNVGKAHTDNLRRAFEGLKAGGVAELSGGKVREFDAALRGVYNSVVVDTRMRRFQNWGEGPLDSDPTKLSGGLRKQSPAYLAFTGRTRQTSELMSTPSLIVTPSAVQSRQWVHVGNREAALGNKPSQLVGTSGSDDMGMLLKAGTNPRPQLPQELADPAALKLIEENIRNSYANKPRFGRPSRERGLLGAGEDANGALPMMGGMAGAIGGGAAGAGDDENPLGGLATGALLGGLAFAALLKGRARAATRTRLAETMTRDAELLGVQPNNAALLGSVDRFIAKTERAKHVSPAIEKALARTGGQYFNEQVQLELKAMELSGKVPDEAVARQAVAEDFLARDRRKMAGAGPDGVDRRDLSHRQPSAEESAARYEDPSWAERGALGYSYSHDMSREERILQAKANKEPTSNFFADMYPGEKSARRYSALDRFIAGGEFGRSKPKSIQHWQGYLSHNVGKGGYDRAEFEAYLKPALEAKQAELSLYKAQRQAAKAAGRPWTKPSPQTEFTTKELFAEFEGKNPLRFDERVYGDKSKAPPPSQEKTPWTHESATLRLVDPEAYDPMGKGFIHVPNGGFFPEQLGSNAKLEMRIGGRGGPSQQSGQILDNIPPFLSRQVAELFYRNKPSQSLKRGSVPFGVEEGVREFIPALQADVATWAKRQEAHPDHYLENMLGTQWRKAGVTASDVRAAVKDFAAQVQSLKIPPPPTGKKLKPLIDAIPLAGNAKYPGYQTTISSRRNYREHLITLPDLPKDKAYTNLHWTAESPAAHARTSDRGRMDEDLHIMEIQSDWSQEATKLGPRTPGLKKELERERSRLDAAMNAVQEERANIRRWYQSKPVLPPMVDDLRRRWESGANLPTDVRAHFDKLGDDLGVLEKESDELTHTTIKELNKPPAPPFGMNPQVPVRMMTKSLVERGIREGYKKISLASGGQVGDMFGLRAEVERVEVLPRANPAGKLTFPPGTETLKVFRPDGAEHSFPLGKRGKKYDTIMSNGLKVRLPSLEQYLGKQTAAWVRKHGGKAETDIDSPLFFWEDGRAGMEDFYDTIAPEGISSVLSKLTGKSVSPVRDKEGALVWQLGGAIKKALKGGQVLPGALITAGGVSALSDNDKKLLGARP